MIMFSAQVTNFGVGLIVGLVLGLILGKYLMEYIYDDFD